MSTKTVKIPDNCIAIGDEAYCLDLSKISDGNRYIDMKTTDRPDQNVEFNNSNTNSKIVAKYKLSYYGYDLWLKDNSPITDNENKLVVNDNCILTNGCSNNKLQDGCIAKCFEIVNNYYIPETLYYRNNKWTKDTLIPEPE